MYENIKTYVESYDQCQRRRKLKNKNKLHNIKAIEPFYQIGIDIIGLLPITSRRKRYIVTVIDYFIKWIEAKALKEANAYEIATFIYKKIICRHECSRKILTDRETHFNNKMIITKNNEENKTETSINERIKYIIKELLKEKEKAKEQIKRSQEKQKKY